MADPIEPRQELTSLVAAFRTYLEAAERRGGGWIPGAPSPRRGTTLPGPAPAASDPSPEPDRAGTGDAVLGEETDANSREDLLAGIQRDLGNCDRCRLAKDRKTLVFGAGNPDADLLFIGEAPGRDEDEQGEPFVGAAGQLLTRMIEAMGLTREEVYIANIIKCRPPQNRDPSPDEMDACEPVLRRQIEAISPRIIIAMGNHATKRLLRSDQGITRLRGRFYTYQGIPLMPTFHPAFLLRNPQSKRPVWEDLKVVMAEMDRLGIRRRRP